VEQRWNSTVNALLKLVEQDKGCAQAEQMEKVLMAFCRTSAGER
jgi:hypothetical protein